MTSTLRDRFGGCLLGLAAGDAVGTAVEFKPRGTFPPVTDMTGGGLFRLAPGEWTDDTSMAMCLAESLLERDGFDPADQMDRYLRWARTGHWSSTGTCVDIGNTVARALEMYRATGEPYAGPRDAMTAGNGSIMRLAPVAMWCHPRLDDAERHAADSSRTTHGARTCVDACRLFARMLVRALSGAGRDEVLSADAATFDGIEMIAAIAAGAYRGKSRDAIRGSGYVVESLEAALWCFANTSSFEQAVLAAANLGDDADTTAAVCGQLAGAHYGEAGIPAHWLARLARRDDISNLADRLHGRAAGEA